MTEQNGSVLGGQPGAGEKPAPAWFEAEGMAPEVSAQFSEVVKTKGWKHPSEALQSYINLEKAFGADKAGRTIMAPKGDDDAEGWNAVYGKLGRPETPEGYKIPVPDGDKGEFAKVAASAFHKLGISQKQAEGLAQWWNETNAAAGQQGEEAFTAQAGIDIQGLKTEWGSEFDAKQELARRAIRQSGLSQEDAIAIERAIGIGKAAKAFATLGQQYAEAPMHGDAGGTPSVATSEGARAKIASLMSDSAFTTRYLNGDKDAVAQMTNLHALAYAGQKS